MCACSATKAPPPGHLVSRPSCVGGTPPVRHGSDGGSGRAVAAALSIATGLERLSRRGGMPPCSGPRTSATPAVGAQCASPRPGPALGPHPPGFLREQSRALLQHPHIRTLMTRRCRGELWYTMNVLDGGTARPARRERQLRLRRPSLTRKWLMRWHAIARRDSPDIKPENIPSAKPCTGGRL